MEIYEPAEDSYLLSNSVKDYLINLINPHNKNKSLSKGKSNIKKIKILDMGSGSGIQAQTCKDLGFRNILAADINNEAVKLLKKQKINAIHSNLFSKLYKRKGDLSGEILVPIRFNLIIFNPPYLPEDKYDKKPDTTAGKKGYELIIKFLKQAKSHLEKNGKILLLFSSLSNRDVIENTIKKLDFKFKLINKKRLFFEELFVYEIYCGALAV